MARPSATAAALAGMPPALLVALLVFGFVPAGRGAREARNEPPPAPSGEPEGDPAAGARDAEALVARVLGQPRASWAECRSCPGPLPSLRVLIATLPDPRDSHISYDFDRYLDSVRRAAEVGGYLLVDFHLPWRDTPTSRSDAPAHRTTPGVLVFRSARAGLLVVWLVGETPTTGVHRGALRAAFEQMRALCARVEPRPDTCDEVPLLGPSFSGSAESLGAELYRQSSADGRPAFRIVSGAATAVDARALEGLLGHGSTFRTTVVPDALTLPTLIDYLDRLGVDRQRVALLVEGNTAYGQGATTLAGGIRQVPFPLQIGRLRRAYEKEQRPEGNGSAAWDMTPRLRRLLLADGDADTIDVAPAFSTVDSHSAEVTLATNLAALSREGVQYVGLFATDVRDKLFLGQQVRRFCPGAVLFTLDADILFLHPDVSGAFEGMLVIAPYPLVGDNQTWSWPFTGRTRRLQFPSTNAQGVYNAALALLERDDLLLEYGAPFADTGSHGIPSLWISVVGRDAFWPLAVTEYRADPDVIYRPSSSPSPSPSPAPSPPLHREVRTAPAGWSAALLMFQALLIALCVAGLAGGVKASRPAARGLTKFAGPLRGVATDAARRTRAVYVFVVLASAASSWLVVVSVAAFGGTWTEWALLHVTGPLLLATIAAVALRAWPEIADSTRRLAQDLGHLRCLDDVASPVSCGLVFLLALTFAWSVRCSDEMTRTLTYLRATQLLGGLSPLPPLFLLGLAGLLWGLCALSRVRLLDALPRGPGARFLNFHTDVLPGVQALEERLLTTLAARTPGPGRLALAWLLIGVPCWQLFVSAGVPGFEGRVFRDLLGVSLALVGVGTLLHIFAFHGLWAGLRAILRRLATRPEIVAACRRLDPALSWSAMLDLATRGPLFADLVESSAQAVRFSQAVPPDLLPRRAARALAIDAARARESLRLVMEHDAAGRHADAVSARLDAQGSLARIAPDVLSALAVAAPERAPGNPSEWQLAALAFVASRVAGFTRHVFAHMRSLLLFSTGSLVLVLLAVMSYPLEPRGMFLLFCWTLILGVVGTTLLILTAIERDVVLSALANTTGGKVDLNRDFLSRVLLHAGVPLLGLLAAQFPGAFRQLAAWLDPLLAR